MSNRCTAENGMLLVTSKTDKKATYMKKVGQLTDFGGDRRMMLQGKVN
jgi:hypothetical protein